MRTKGAWSVDLVAQVRILGKQKDVVLRRLTHEELDAVGLRPTSAEGYDSRAKIRLGLAPEAAAREAARRISEATGIPVEESPSRRSPVLSEPAPTEG